MKKLCGFILCLVFLLSLSSVAQALPIRVALNTKASAVTLTVTKGSYTVTGGIASKQLGTLQEGNTLVGKYTAGGQWALTIAGKDCGTIDPPISIVSDQPSGLVRYGSTRYRGSFGLLLGGLVTNTLEMDDYLKGVIGKEIGYGVPVEALKAQAITSRSYAYTCMKQNSWYDVVATTSNQVYGGYEAEIVSNGDKVVQAVEDTKNQVMYYKMPNGSYNLVEAYFHAHAGGYTENVENIWGGANYPYLKGVPSPYDSGAPAAYNSWTVTYTADEMTNLVNKYRASSGAKGEFGNFVSIETSTAGSVSGRVLKVVIKGTKGSVTVQRDAIRSFLGGLKSTMFTIDTTANGTNMGNAIYVNDYLEKPTKKTASTLCVTGGDQNTATLKDVTGIYVEGATTTKNIDSTTVVANQKITITGKGWGHGVGMSQWGAIGMAKDQKSCEEILRHYYGGNNSANLIITEVGSY